MSVNMWLDLVRFAGPYYIIFFFLRTEFTEVDVNADLVCVCVCVWPVFLLAVGQVLDQTQDWWFRSLVIAFVTVGGVLVSEVHMK
jgi:hypothetical protein